MNSDWDTWNKRVRNTEIPEEEWHIVSVLLFRLFCFLDCGAGVCFSRLKDRGILRDKMKCWDNKNYGTKSSDKKSFESVSKHYTDITW